MEENKIQEILNMKYLSEIENELIRLKQNGFDLNKIDKRIIEKMDKLRKQSMDNNDPNRPVQHRKISY